MQIEEQLCIQTATTHALAENGHILHTPLWGNNLIKWFNSWSSFCLPSLAAFLHAQHICLNSELLLDVLWLPGLNLNDTILFHISLSQCIQDLPIPLLLLKRRCQILYRRNLHTSYLDHMLSLPRDLTSGKGFECTTLAEGFQEVIQKVLNAHLLNRYFRNSNKSH